jgi:hypothetical protein
MDGIRALESAVDGLERLYDRETLTENGRQTGYGLFVAMTYMRGMIQALKDNDAGGIIDRAALPAPEAEKVEEVDDPDKTVVTRVEEPPARRSAASRR